MLTRQAWLVSPPGGGALRVRTRPARPFCPGGRRTELAERLRLSRQARLSSVRREPGQRARISDGPRGFTPRGQCERRSLRCALEPSCGVPLRAFSTRRLGTACSGGGRVGLRALPPAASPRSPRRPRPIFRSASGVAADRVPHLKGSELFEILPCGGREHCTAGARGVGYEILVRLRGVCFVERRPRLRVRLASWTTRPADASVERWGLAPCPVRRFCAHGVRPPWTLRFHAPKADAELASGSARCVLLSMVRGWCLP
mgnify:CR=1 FL=1